MKTGNKKLRISLFIGIPVLLAVIGIAMFLSLNPPGSGGENSGGGGANPKIITLAQYNQVEKGMSYSQVVEILGTEGALQSEAGEKGSDSYLTVYLWKGKLDNSRAVMVFTGDKMAAKTHVGITDNAEQ
jgi:hypothetical protein